MFCSKCGKEIREGANFCADCGAPVNDDKNDVSSKNIQGVVYRKVVYEYTGIAAEKNYANAEQSGNNGYLTYENENADFENNLYKNDKKEDKHEEMSASELCVGIIGGIILISIIIAALQEYKLID